MNNRAFTKSIENDYKRQIEYFTGAELQALSLQKHRFKEENRKGRSRSGSLSEEPQTGYQVKPEKKD
jgi:hypothetical protein